jgi:hypothetical protein
MLPSLKIWRIVIAKICPVPIPHLILYVHVRERYILKMSFYIESPAYRIKRWIDLFSCICIRGWLNAGFELFGHGDSHLATLVMPVWGGGGCTYGTAVSWLSSVWKRVRWCEIQTKWRRSVVGERFCEAVLASPHPWQSPDCIPIVGSVKALVQNDKSFNHTKVWCTFIFIDLQAS